MERPGGLTALAVLNFVFGGLQAILLLGVFALLGAVTTAGHGDAIRTQQGVEIFTISLLLGSASVALLIASGIGYLQLKRGLGWKLGNLYGVVSIGGTAFNLTLGGSSFSVGTLIFILYPALTLVLLNTTFKDDFVH